MREKVYQYIKHVNYFGVVKIDNYINKKDKIICVWCSDA